MALLYRFSKLNDRHNTGIFTFIVTRSVTRDLHRDATTKDFYYGFHRWAISFTRANDKVLGVYLILRDASPNATCLADYSLTLLNREHFSRNEQYAEKQCKFTADHPAHGINKWIPLSDIQSRNFGDETSEFLLELSIGNVMTVFETNLPLQGNASSSTSSNSNNHSSNGTGNGSNSHHHSHHHPITFKNGKIETSYFHFATFEWNISIVSHNASGGGAANMVRTLFKDSSTEPDFRGPEGSGRSYIVFLNRLTGFENSCRCQYRMVIGQGQFREDSGMLEQLSDMNGRSRGYQIDQHSFNNLITLGSVPIYFEFMSCNPVSETKVPITRNLSPTINCYDRNKQGWCIEADLETEYLKLKLYFMDMHSVPRNHLRYVSWYTFALVQNAQTGLRESVPIKGAPHFNYYIQDGIDMGVVMDTNILVSDIKATPKLYLENESHLTVHVEWYDSIMLFNHIYHKYDDIARTHCHQMRREISALTSENYSLERQIFAYQRSISVANNIARMSISSPSKPTTSIGFSSSSGSYRTMHTDSGSYYGNNELISSPANVDPYYEREISSGLQELTNHQMIRSPSSHRVQSPQVQQPSSLQGSPQQPQPQQYLSSVSQSPYYANFGAVSNNSGSGSNSGTNSARQSFSGPASPHHQPSQYSSQYHHHQLPIIPNSKLTYSSSPNYHMLNSPNSSNPGSGQLYHHIRSNEDLDQVDDNTNGDVVGGVGTGATDEYSNFASLYKLKT